MDRALTVIPAPVWPLPPSSVMSKNCAVHPGSISTGLKSLVPRRSAVHIGRMPAIERQLADKIACESPGMPLVSRVATT